jgi:hypothetical protein
MSTIAIEVKSKEDVKLFASLAKRLKLRARVLTLEEKEDIALAYAIDEGRESGYVSEETVLQTLSEIKKP